ncbi:MAG: IclR family transcriptional regulator [Acidocella sp.]|nr:IclR family transcriptional regulator [Acidocella sp.]
MEPLFDSKIFLTSCEHRFKFRIKESYSSMRNEQKDGRLSSVATAMLLLKSFTDEHNELGIGALSRQLGLAKSTVHRLASTLLDAGMLDQNKETGKYRLGVTIFELGMLARRKMDIYNEAKIFLRELREKTRETVNLAIMRDDSLIYLNSLEGPSAIKVRSHMGLRLSAHCSAEGKVLLAFGAPDEQARVVAQGLSRQTLNTITDPAVFAEEMKLVEDRGYATDYEESEIGVRSIAVPVFSGGNDVAAAVGISGPVQRLTKRTLISYLPALTLAAEAVSIRLGASPRYSPAALRVAK